MGKKREIRTGRENEGEREQRLAQGMRQSPRGCEGEVLAQGESAEGKELEMERNQKKKPTDYGNLFY